MQTARRCPGEECLLSTRARCNNASVAHKSFLLSWLASSLLVGCSALIEPDETRLGGSEGGILLRDAAMPSDGALPRDGGRVDGGSRDSGCTLAPSCAGGVVTSCSGTTPCALGCAPTGEARCAEMAPSNVAATLWRDDAPSVELLAGTIMFDTGACTSTSAATMIVPQLNGPELCVVMVRDLTMRTGAWLVVRGARPLVLMASGNVVVESGAIIDVSARGRTAGPGGGVGGRPGSADGQGEAPGIAGVHAGTYDDGGGGGGGFCGVGGSGGMGGTGAGGTGGGPASAALLVPLRGGSGGGLGRGANQPGTAGTTGPGGAGGGALQISALGELRIEGSLLAGGGGGQGGGNDSVIGNWGAGGGGGSGGAILLEARTLIVGVAAVITTSGGGGGGGGGGTSAGGPGDDGALSLDRAARGTSGGTYGAAGGVSGGAATLGGDAGDNNTVATSNGGGGGGGAGCVVYRTANGALPANAMARTSGSVGPSLANAPILLR